MGKCSLLMWLLFTGCGCGGDEAKPDASGDGGGSDAMPVQGCVVEPTCGPAATSSCCDSPMVPGGSFARSYDVSGEPAYSTSTYSAAVSTFRLDTYEVTVGRFRQFVNAGAGTQANPPAAGAGAHANIPNSGWDPAWNANLAADTTAFIAAISYDTTLGTWTPSPGDNENRPINGITWYDAMAFCAWDGGFLPTEAEWNYAASGGNEQRAYPWSSPAGSVTIDPTHASYYDQFDGCVGDGVPACELTDLVPAGSKPAGKGRWGHSDLGGNVFEWVLDWWDSTYPTPCSDCANLMVSTVGRVARGGSYSATASNSRTGRRFPNTPETRSAGIGVRCARAP